jgi:hypothetical protein
VQDKELAQGGHAIVEPRAGIPKVYNIHRPTRSLLPLCYTDEPFLYIADLQLSQKLIFLNFTSYSFYLQMVPTTVV